MTSTKRSPAVLAGTNRAEIDTSTVSTAKDTATDLSPQARWRADNPEKVWAQRALRAAVKMGIVEPKPCERCGGEPAEAHHPEYSRPADVIWLCRPCHKRVHAAERQEGGAL